jgi:hypothetical protein
MFLFHFRLQSEPGCCSGVLPGVRAVVHTWPPARRIQFFKQCQALASDKSRHIQRSLLLFVHYSVVLRQ